MKERMNGCINQCLDEWMDVWKKGRKVYVLFNDALNTLYLRL